MTRFRAAIALCTSLLAAACLPVTTSVPVGSTAGFKPDPSLTGTWIATSADKNDKDSGAAYFHFLPQADGSMTVVMVPYKASDKDAGDWSVYKVQAATLGANHYLNAQEISNNGQAPEDSLSKTFPLLYRTSGDGRVTLYLVDEDAAKAAIQAGKIKGEIEPGEFGDVHITADAAALDAFFASPQGLALFTKPLLTMRRAE